MVRYNTSDHRPLVTQIHSKLEKRVGQFWFDKQWCGKPDFAMAVTRGWNAHQEVNGRSMFDRISDYRRELSKWKRTTNL